MKNLLKNVLRSFLRTKIALISLTFLIFLSAGVFSLLNSTTSNLKNSYDNLVQKGNLDEFVVNEKYDYGLLQFERKNGRIELTENSKGNPLVKQALEQNRSKYEKLTGFSHNLGRANNEETTTLLQKARANLLEALENDPNIKVDKILKEQQVSFRKFQTIDITDGNIQKKVVQSNPEDQIDKLVLYQGQPLPAANSFLELQQLYSELTKKDWSKHPREIFANNKYLPLFVNWQKNIDGTKDAKLNKYLAAIKYATQGKWSDSLTPEETIHFNNLKQIFLSSKSKFTNDGWKYVVEWQDQVPLNFRVLDYSAYGAIVAPGNFAIEQKRDQKEVYQDLDNWNNILKLGSEQFEAAFNQIDSKYKIKISATEYLILGVGITPDFMYPVFNGNALIPNPESQYLYYTNTSGYKRIRSAFLTNPIEANLVAKFPENATTEQRTAILEKINKWSRQFMSWPSTIQAAYLSSDQTNILNLNAARTTFIPYLVSTISLVSALLTIVIIGLALFVGVLIIKNYITKNRQNLAILQSNGIKRWKINLSILLFSIIPSIIGGIFGYLVTFGLQSTAVSLFSSYWFIPVSISLFNIGFFFLAIFLPLLIFLIASLTVGYFVLKQNVVKSLKNDSDYKVSKLSIIMKAPLVKFNVITRFRASLAFNSFWKLIILCSLSIATMVVFNFAITANGNFASVEEKTRKTHHYQYAIDLATPTIQSGLIKYQSFKELGQTDPVIKNKNPHYFLANTRINPNDPTFNNWGNLHVPDLFLDGIDSPVTNNIIYLKNLVQSKISLDYNIGVRLGTFDLTVNPWMLSQSLMPANQVSASNFAYQEFLKEIWQRDKNAQDFIDQTLTCNDSNNEDCNVHYEIKPQVVQDGALTSQFKNFLIKQFNMIANKKYQPLDYKITYNVIGLDEKTIGDPRQQFANGKSSPKYAYTRIEGEDFDQQKVMIKGIKDWIGADGQIPDDYLGPILTNSENQIINHDLFSNDTRLNGNNNSQTENQTYPLIVNLYTAKKYDLAKGSQFQVKVTNTYDRIFSKINAEINNKQTVTFNVIGINNSAKDNEFYTSYQAANKILKFNDDEIINNLPFNGFYTNNLLTFNQSTPLFSESGLFPGTSSFSQDNNLMKIIIENTIKDPTKPGYFALLKALGKKDSEILNIQNVQTYLEILNKTYGGLPYTSMINFIYNASANQGIFNSVSTTSVMLQNIVIGIIVPIVVLIVILISNMLIDELRKIGIRLKALGYSNIKILISFLSVYIPVFVIGLIISVPISIAFIQTYDAIIFSNTNIILNSILNPWTVIASLLSLTLVFTVSLISNWISLRRLKIAQEIKNC